MGMFREACEIIHRMWTEDYPRFEGKYYTIDAPINEPKGVQKPHPSFWIGGGGERVTLKLVARWGDACNVAGSVPADVDTIRHKLDVLKRHCDDLGRDYDEIIKSTSVNVHVVDDMDEAERATADARGDKPYDDYATGTIVGTPEMIRERLEPVIEAGIDYFIVTIPREAYDQEAVRRFAREVIPLFG
jgi:alkanesulfonate monooxygenase SsuD/methylene tetrahydromethanopterin reductase-like flavin-dependent oxidoreductase (luciferase family)